MSDSATERFPNNIEDCICSLAYLRAHAEEYQIDPDRILVMGYSAGAHLASLVGLASELDVLRPALAVCPAGEVCDFDLYRP